MTDLNTRIQNALARIQQIVNGDSANQREQIRNIVKEFSAKADKPNAMLYAGRIDGKSAWETATKLARDTGLAVIDDTDRGRLMLLDPFRKAVRQAVRNDFKTAPRATIDAEFAKFLAGDEKALWRSASRENADHQDLIRWSIQEVRRIAIKLAQRRINPAYVIAWSCWRRAHQAAVRRVHLKTQMQL